MIEQPDKERWKDVVGYEGLYQVSNLGRVKSKDRIIKYSDGRTVHRRSFIKRPTYSNGGYPRIGLQVNGKLVMKFVHRLVAEAFIPNPNNYPIVNHKDEDKNNFVASNLEWCDYSYNTSYSNKGILPTSATVADVYVAINSQYHDYAELFKNWFGDGIEQKIVESAIVFWFKDADCKAENKVVEYLGEY